MMRLHLRKAAQAQVDMTRETPILPSLDFLESELIDAAAEEHAEVGLGRMVVIATQLLETARRADPAYGLQRTEQ